MTTHAPQAAQFVQQPFACGPSARKKTHAVEIRWNDTRLQVGGGAPVVVQSMTNTDTADAIGTAIQVRDLAFAGSEVVRITVNTIEAAREVPAGTSRAASMVLTVIRTTSEPAKARSRT